MQQDIPLAAPPEPGPLLVGFSGGLDSTVLLHRLAARRPADGRTLKAIHVHHGLQPQADAWAAHCQRVCAALAVPLEVVRVAVDATRGTGPEAAARAARHAAFGAALEEGGILALAHHRDDQAETFLLRALRGSGVDGLAAMRPWRRYAQGWLWRPLLEVARSQLLAHARANALAWIEDPSNACTDADRNFLRHRVLPLLHERWPRAAAGFARSAGLAAESGDLLAAQDGSDLAAVRTIDPEVLDAARLLRLPPARRARVLRRWIAALGLPPLPAAGIARIESDLLLPAVRDAPAFAWSGAVVRRWRDLLHAGPRREPLPAAFRTAWDGRAPLPLPTGDALLLEPADAAEEHDPPERARTRPPAVAIDCSVHARSGGERILLPGRTHTHSLKHVLQELGIPPWVRARLPLLSDAQGALLAAGDLVRSAAFDARLQAHGLRLRWRRQAAS